MLLHQSFPLQIESLVGTTNSEYLMEWELCLQRSLGSIIKLCYAFLVFRISDFGLRRTCKPRGIGNVLGWYFTGLCGYAGCSITCALSIPGGAAHERSCALPYRIHKTRSLAGCKKHFMSCHYITQHFICRSPLPCWKLQFIPWILLTCIATAEVSKDQFVIFILP